MYCCIEKINKTVLGERNPTIFRGEYLDVKSTETSKAPPMDPAKRQDLVQRALQRHFIKKGQQPLPPLPPPGVPLGKGGAPAGPPPLGPGALGCALATASYGVPGIFPPVHIPHSGAIYKFLPSAVRAVGRGK